MRKELVVKDQSVDTSGITKDYREAIIEYIWNGFEANATEIIVSYVPNGIGGLDSLTIKDNGDGIPFDSLEDTFGAFLASTKNSLSLQLKTKANKGKGRFSCFSFATSVRWNTVVKLEGKNVEYNIDINGSNKNEYDFSAPIPTEKETGTVVTIYGIADVTEDSVQFEALEETLLQNFAWYLFLNREKDVAIVVNGEKIDYSKYIDEESSRKESITIDSHVFAVSIIVWAERIRENFSSYYLDESGVLRGKDTTTFNRNTVNFNHSVYVKSSFFDNKENVTLTSSNSEIEGQTSLGDKDKATLRKLKKALQEIIGTLLKQHMTSQADKAIAAMIERDSFPHFGNSPYDQIRRNDLIRVSREIYCFEPRIFFKLRDVQEKSLLGFLNLLLSSEERENILTIIESVVELTPEQRAEFSLVLERTKLANIVETIHFVEERYKVIAGLKRILYELNDYANERDHIQEIIESNYWLFGEQYNLVSADQGMKRALSQYLSILYGEDAPEAELLPDEQSNRRMDIFTCSKRKVENYSGNAEEENLIIELKAPNVILSKKVLRQIEDYMDFVRKQPQFNSQYRHWRFIAVCATVDDDVRSRYDAQKVYGKKGLVQKIDNYEVYALTWDDVFKSFELSHDFLLERLKVNKELISEELSAESGTESSRETVDMITLAVK